MTTEMAVAQITKYGHLELQLLSQKSEKQIALAAAEKAGGDSLLDGDADDSIERAVRLQVELRQIDLAITSCRSRRLAAIADKLDAEVQEFRQRAADSRRQAEAITAKTKPLFEQIKQLENVDYAALGGTPQSVHHAGRAVILEREAQQREARGIERHGNVQIDGVLSVHEIALAVLEVAADGPTAAEVIRWIETREHRDQFDAHKISVRISWDAGAITAGSQIRLLEPLQPPAAAPPEPEAPATGGGRLVSVNEFFGYGRGKTA